MPRRGEHLSPEHLAKLIESNRTRVLSAESRAKISAANLLRPAPPPRTPETRAKLSAALKGKKRTPEQCARISAAQKGKTLSPEHRAKVGAIHRGVPKSDVARSRNRETHLNLPVIGECVYCLGPAHTHDHMIPRGRPGWDHPYNVVLACTSCNASKNNRTPEEWFAGLSREVCGGPKKDSTTGRFLPAEHQVPEHLLPDVVGDLSFQEIEA